MDRDFGLPPAKVDTTGWLIFLGVVALILLFVWFVTHPSLTSTQYKVFYAYVLAAAFGGAVGATELVARYRDKPTAALGTVPAGIYMLLNALASLVAFWLLFEGRLAFEIDLFKGHRALNDLLLGGFGAMALF